MKTWKEEMNQYMQTFYSKGYNVGLIAKPNNAVALLVNFDRYNTTFSDLVTLLDYIIKSEKGKCLSKIHIYVDLCPNENLIQYFDETNLSDIDRFIDSLYTSIALCMICNRNNSKVFVHFNKKQIKTIGSGTDTSFYDFIKNEIKSYENLFMDCTTLIEKGNETHKLCKGQYVVIGLPLSSNPENRISFQNLYSETCIRDFDYLKPFYRLNSENGKIFKYESAIS